MKIAEILATRYVHPDVNKILKKYEKRAKGKATMGFHSIMAYPYRVKEVVEGNKIRLSRDPKYFGAVGVEKYNSNALPITNIPIKQLIGFEPEDKMSDPKSMAKVNAIAKAVQGKQSIGPILARRYKNGYQVIDGHHRFWGHRKAGANFIKAKIVPPQDIEEAAGVGRKKK